MAASVSQNNARRLSPGTAAFRVRVFHAVRKLQNGSCCVPVFGCHSGFDFRYVPSCLRTCLHRTCTSPAIWTTQHKSKMRARICFPRGNGDTSTLISLQQRCMCHAIQYSERGLHKRRHFHKGPPCRQQGQPRHFLPTSDYVILSHLRHIWEHSRDLHKHAKCNYTPSVMHSRIKLTQMMLKR